MKRDSAKPAELQLDQNAACDSCGQFGAFHIGNRTLCPECYQEAGACCAGCGEDDSDA